MLRQLLSGYWQIFSWLKFVTVSVAANVPFVKYLPVHKKVVLSEWKSNYNKCKYPKSVSFYVRTLFMTLSSQLRHLVWCQLTLVYVVGVATQEYQWNHCSWSWKAQVLLSVIWMRKVLWFQKYNNYHFNSKARSIFIRPQRF